MKRFTSASRITVALLALLTARCLCSEAAATLGDPCGNSGDCDDSLVCVLLDETNSGGERVCVPMKDVDEPLPCTETNECLAAAFPVDATCVDGLCACVGDTFTFACAFDSVIDAHTCRCVLAPVDAGPESVDGGPESDAGPE